MKSEIMKDFFPYRLFLVVLLSTAVGTLLYFLTGAGQSRSGEEALSQKQAELLFVHEVLPLLKQKCLGCHGGDPDKIEGDFKLASREDAIKGGESGNPALVPGDPEASPLYTAVTWKDKDFEMPPKENDRLSAAQVELVRRWIAAGAPWPAKERIAELRKNSTWEYSDGVQVKVEGAQSEEWANRRYRPEDLWAFSPVREHAVPRIRPGQHPIDAFIHQQLEKHHLARAHKADKITLLRRATFDLTGLPPTPEEVQDFLRDTSPEAFVNVIDRLLESPRYGEQWGRHWLDVVRYADTNGFANDFERPNAWRYRDYVVRAFNQDKPFNRFILEQLAGDELDAEDPEMLIATGFLRMGPWEHTAMSVAAETRQFFLDDVTNSVGETFLSIPLTCARCHDHKFDPIPTKDYYRIQAAFAPVQFAERPASYLPWENQTGFREGKQRLEKLKEETEKELSLLSKKEEDSAKKWMMKRRLPYKPKKERLKLPDNQRPPRFYGLSDRDLGYRKVLQKRQQNLNIELDRYEPLAFSVYNGPLVENRYSQKRMTMQANPEGDLQRTFILAGGSLDARGEEVRPGVLSVIRALEKQRKALPGASIPDTRQGRRLALAYWMASRQNPLVTRSVVNRIWQNHFGLGLAGNANNFGAMGKKPTHPELLDWLTLYFIDNGWSFKRLHRLIMTSETYQQASDHPEINRIREKDPENAWLAYFSPRRLKAEELRDAMLQVSGELELQMGGLPVFPEINSEVALQPRHLMGSVAPAYQPSRTPRERNRRTIYTYVYRGMPDPMLEVFNQPSTDFSCERRIASTVTPQVFTLWNSQNSYNRALAMAARLQREAGTLTEQIKLAIRLAWNREATETELADSEAYVAKMRQYHEQNAPVARQYPVTVKREMFEEMTGQVFEYEERLDIYEDYVPDLDPASASAATRALSDLCLVLFNANEFVYIY
jgi:mono/diheme cytochrome c family protein